MSWPDDNTQDDFPTREPHNIPLHQAIADNDLSRVTNLLDIRIDINIQDQRLQTALHHAVDANSAPMVQLLLSRGADTTLRDWGTYDEPEGFTPIEIAAQWNSIAAMEELITYGVDFVSSRAVFFAARENHMDMLRLLFDKMPGKMADTPNQQAIAGALRVSAKNQNLEQVRYILQEVKLELEADTRDAYWQGALDQALLAVLGVDCCSGDSGLPHGVRAQQWDHAIRVIDTLIEAGASINAYDDRTKRTALHCALGEQDPPLKLIISLLQHGADPNSRDSLGRSPFFELLQDPLATSIELVKIFTDAGAVVGPPTANGQTPLHVVRRHEIASWLLAEGADVAAVDDQGELPLHKASSLRNLELVSLYLEAGSPIDVRNNLGWTPFMQSPSASVSKMLFDHGADIHAATKQGITAFQHAVQSCNLELVSFLLANGADVQARAVRQEWLCVSSEQTTAIIADNTPLHLAIASYQGVLDGNTLGVVTALLDHGANIEARDGTGKTPLLLAISRDYSYSSPTRTWTHNEKVVNCLLERGADPHVVDDSGKNAVQLADARTYRYMFSETGNFERRPIPPPSLCELNSGPGRGWRRRGGGRGELYLKYQ
jgi:ankyrin repeat protein